MSDTASPDQTISAVADSMITPGRVAVAKAWARQLQREGGAEFVNSFSFRVAGEGGGVEVLVVHVPTGRTLDLTEVAADFDPEAEG